MLKDNMKKFTAYQLKKAIYPIVTLIYFIIIGILLSSMAGFIKKNANEALMPVDENIAKEKITVLDLDNYEVVAKKLNLHSDISTSTAPPP